MITLVDVFQLHKNSIKDFGGSPGIRDVDSLKSAVSRPFQSFEDVELYPSVFEKTAAIFESLIKNHPFVDGNKRTGFLAAYALLYRNKFELVASKDKAYDFVIQVSSTSLSFDVIAIWFRKNSMRL
ncbi:MAG TPA: type II toxin-antitoxin system death-on-curing family toxin [Segetibacter sp.]|nr:type II toxin-antitoxin system death-on-curing family toxin [Segetibacter sp.]